MHELTWTVSPLSVITSIRLQELRCSSGHVTLCRLRTSEARSSDLCTVELRDVGVLRSANWFRLIRVYVDSMAIDLV
ncbi:hypothetical protein KCU81_g146, partial [Aureobasidium melanogenum]